jgi:hypothetical protein
MEEFVTEIKLAIGEAVRTLALNKLDMSDIRVS